MPSAPRMLCVMAALGVALPSPTAAQATAAGAWTAGPLRVRFDLSQWGPDCGEQPSRAESGGGNVTVRTSGDHLVFVGALEGGTQACDSDDPEVQRISSSAQTGRWATACRTGGGNSRQESGRYVWELENETRLVYSETTTYDWQLQGSRCVATRHATRVLTRPAPELDPVAQPGTPETTPGVVLPPPSSACTPGAPVSVRLRGPTSPIAPGERACLSASVLDATGCALPVTPAFTVVAPHGRVGRMVGACFVAEERAAAAEGRFRVTATYGSSSATADVVVQARDLSGLVAERTHERHTRDEAPEAGAASHVEARAGAPRRTWPIALAGLVAAACLAALIAVQVRRRREPRKRPADRRPPRSSQPVPAPASKPAPRPVAAPPSVPHRAIVAAPLPSSPALASVPSPEPEGATATPPPATGRERICPTCRRGYPAESRFCPHDADELVPYGLFVATERRRAEQDVGAPKICPTCGSKYGPRIVFCGKDGSELVSVM